ncbi:MAG TPA: sigma-54 dependent transcriptional regulator [Terriglobales bacterium]|jgi:DNA-binding NtrC family response regulator|nr:sigma-54 dependent transcriptional regulator [Terriglobales bacterium]
MMTSEAGKILVVDDDADMRGLLSDVLESDGYRVGTAESGEKALQALAEEQYDLVLTDLRMKGMLGTALLSEIKHRYPDTGVILMTAFGTVETAIEAMKGGAMDYLIKPVKTEDVLRTAGRAAREVQLRREVTHLRREVYKEYSFHQILGKSRPMQEVFELIRRVADSPSNLLITGESGTGKELVAKAIHYNSDRRDRPFVAVNSAAIPEQLLESELFGHMRGAFTDAKADRPGLFEEAQKGTLFLDEISELPLMLQAKLLRAIQEREIRRVGSTKSIPVDVRIIAATNLNLADEVKAKHFREDLYYRLNVIEIRLPPLRDRRDDIPLLVETFLHKCAKANRKPLQGVSESSLALLIDYSWPGNVRELENIIERAVTLARGEKIMPEDLPATVQGSRGDRRVLDDAAERTLPLQEVEWEYIKKILEKTGGNKYQAAQALGIDRKTLYRKLAEMEGGPAQDKLEK